METTKGIPNIMVHPEKAGKAQRKYYINYHEDLQSDEEAKANCELIKESFEIINETGLTPRQLLEQRDEIINRLEFFKSAIEQTDYSKQNIIDFIDNTIIQKTTKAGSHG